MEQNTMRNPWFWGSALAVVVVLSIVYGSGWIGGGEATPTPTEPTVQQTE